MGQDDLDETILRMTRTALTERITINNTDHGPTSINSF